MKILCLITLATAACASNAVVMFNNVNPPAIQGFANVDAGATMLDDVAIPVARLNGATMLDVTRIDVRVFAPLAGTYRIRGWQAPAIVQGTQPAPGTPAFVGFRDFAPTANNQSLSFSFGDGTSVLFRTPLLAVNFSGVHYGLFYFGLSFDAPLSNIGWYTANTPDDNLSSFWKYYAPGDARNGITTLGGGQHGSFYITVHGNPVPEPISGLALALGLVFMSRRRR